MDKPHNSKRRLAVSLLGFGTLLAFSLPLRIFEAVEPPMNRIHILLIGYILGILAQVFLFPSPASARLRGWMRRWALLCLGAWLVLLVLHGLWVAEGEKWQKIYVVSWEREANCECSKFVNDARCSAAVRSDSRCVFCLTFDVADIKQCWGEQRIKTVAGFLAGCYFSFGVSYGGKRRKQKRHQNCNDGDYH